MKFTLIIDFILLDIVPYSRDTYFRAITTAQPLHASEEEVYT
jgi:hypothetical protein